MQQHLLRSFRVLGRAGAWAVVLLATAGAWSQSGADSPLPVDEPEGPRSNLGGSLWHYRRNPELIGEFHTYLQQRGLSPSDLLDAEDLQPPPIMVRILIEPEELTSLPPGAWSVASWAEASNGGGVEAPDGGTHQYVPLALCPPRAGTYRLWVRYYAREKQVGPIGIQIFPTGEEDPLPLLDVLANEWLGQPSGWHWASFLVDLPAEEVELRITHEYAEHQAPGPRGPRRLDCLYLTTEGWREAPPLEQLAAVWREGQPGGWVRVQAVPSNQLERAAYDFRRQRLQAVRTQEVPFGQNEAERRVWAEWMARPADWELSERYPRLFAVSREFWREKVDQLASVSHDPLPDYRDLSRQLIFDDAWNLIGNPVMVAAQVRRLIKAFPSPRGPDYAYQWIEAEDFDHLGSGWQRSRRSGSSRGCLRPVREDGGATAWQDVWLDRPGRYALWVRMGILGPSCSPLRITVRGVAQTERDFTEGGYPSDSGSDWTWQKIGIVEAPRAGTLRVKIQSLPGSAGEGTATQSAPPRPDPDFFYRWIEAEDLETIAYDWGPASRSGNSGDRCVGMGVDATGGIGYAAQEVKVEEPGAYYLWVRKGAERGKYSPLRILMLGPGYGPPERRTDQDFWITRRDGDNQADLDQGTLVQRDLDGNGYEMDPPGSWTWQRVGPLQVTSPGSIRLEVYRRHYPYLYEGRSLTPEDRRSMAGHYFDCLVLTNNPDYRPQGIYPPTGPEGLYLRPAVDCVLVTDHLTYRPRLTQRPRLTLPEYQRRGAALGAPPEKGYLVWVDDPYGDWRWNDWPREDPARSGADRIYLALPRGSVRAASLHLRSLRDQPIRFRVDVDPFRGPDGATEAPIEWRVVGWIAYSSSGNAWGPAPLLRRRFVTLPPYHTAQVWLTIDGRDLAPGTYRGTVTLTPDAGFPARRVPVEFQVAGRAIEPRRPILLGGYHEPFPGRVYWEDFRDHGINIAERTPYLSRAERERRGYRVVMYNLGEFGEERDAELRRQHRTVLETMRKYQVGFEEAMWNIGDEPSGKASVFAYDGRIAHEMEPRIQTLFNPGIRAGLETFQSLDPYTSVWQPYVKHFDYPDRVAIFSVKPYLWYTTPCYSDHTPGLPREMYAQIRSIPARPGRCLGFRFFSVAYRMRDAWDAAYETIPDQSIFVLPSRQGPVPTRAWEAVGEAAQHANLATMLKEKAAAQGREDRYAPLVAEGSFEELLETLRADFPRPGP